MIINMSVTKQKNVLQHQQQFQTSEKLYFVNDTLKLELEGSYNRCHDIHHNDTLPGDIWGNKYRDN